MTHRQNKTLLVILLLLIAAGPFIVGDAPMPTADTFRPTRTMRPSPTPRISPTPYPGPADTPVPYPGILAPTFDPNCPPSAVELVDFSAHVDDGMLFGVVFVLGLVTFLVLWAWFALREKDE